MIIYKSQDEIELMREQGPFSPDPDIWSHWLAPGHAARAHPRRPVYSRKRLHPGLGRLQGYKNAICTSVKRQVVHGIPTNRSWRGICWLRPADLTGASGPMPA